MDRVPIPPVRVSGCARRKETVRHRSHLPPDLLYDPRYAIDSPLWDTWLDDRHDLWRDSFFSCRPLSPGRPRPARAENPPQKRRRTCVRGLKPTPSLSPYPPPPPPITEEEEAGFMRHLMEDFMNTHDERRWEGLET
ncbi:hypothetical protein D1007_43793 [Hordeum vulgare]|nr:hypothetical protein D1007_43793 [Hordeum vulgare]